MAICAIFRNEARYLNEWIQFHRAVGIEHFFLYNNQSDDQPESILARYIEEGLVTLINWQIPYRYKAQRRAYADCLDRTRGLYRWLGFIDIDEFLFSPTNELLPTVMRRFEEYPGVVAYWQVYGSGGNLKHAGSPVTERFVYRAKTNWVRNRRVKSIVDPERTIAPLSAHHFTYHNEEAAVDETGKRVYLHRNSKLLRRFKRRLGSLLQLLPIDPFTGTGIHRAEITTTLLRINHYPVKSHEEFQRKSRLHAGRHRYEVVDYFAYHDRNDVRDPILVDYIQQLS